jgi:hypothetical protein
MAETAATPGAERRAKLWSTGGHKCEPIRILEASEGTKTERFEVTP